MGILIGYSLCSECKRMDGDAPCDCWTKCDLEGCAAYYRKGGWCIHPMPAERVAVYVVKLD